MSKRYKKDEASEACTVTGITISEWDAPPDHDLIVALWAAGFSEMGPQAYANTRGPFLAAGVACAAALACCQRPALAALSALVPLLYALPPVGAKDGAGRGDGILSGRRGGQRRWCACACAHCVPVSGSAVENSSMCVARLRTVYRFSRSLRRGSLARSG